MKHPIQTLYKDSAGNPRFTENAIVRHLLDKYPGGLNALSELALPREDWCQFAQLIGYSLGGYSSLSYVDAQSYEVAYLSYKNKDQRDIQIKVLTKELKQLRKALCKPMAQLFGVHPDDLRNNG